MKKKYQVFVSSTYKDLIDERREVMQALLELDCIPTGMELFQASDSDQVRYDEVISWTELYDAADLAAKKMIVANLINRVEIGENYAIHIDLNVDLKHFNIQIDMCA